MTKGSKLVFAIALFSSGLVFDLPSDLPIGIQTSWAAPAATFEEAASWNGRVLDGQSGHELEFSELLGKVAARVPGEGQIVLGEKHDTPAVQAMQARIVRGVMGLEAGVPFSLGWEFLNARDQTRIHDQFSRFRHGEIDGAGFLTAVMGSTHDVSYVPILEAVRDLGGELLGLNLSREEKAPVVQGGISAADPVLVPPGYETGSPGYYERFAQVMSGGHASPGQIDHYFDAQCLTDDVLAYHLLQEATNPIRFLVVGSFHTEYRDGVVRRLEVRASHAPTVLVRIIDASDYTEKELVSLREDPRYGVLADYLVFVNEPQAGESARASLFAK